MNPTSTRRRKAHTPLLLILLLTTALFSTRASGSEIARARPGAPPAAGDTVPGTAADRKAAAADSSMPGRTFELSGIVYDAAGLPLAGALVAVVDEGPAVRTDSTGTWKLTMRSGEHRVRVTAPGHEPAVRTLVVSSDAKGIDFALALAYRHSERVVVQAIRADAEVPVTKTDLARGEIERQDYGQEMPFLLAQTPSVTSYADSGTGAGYSYFYIRGIQQTRVNMTFDGAPLNDPEQSAVYFSNFGDFIGAVGSLQVQRGVGASTIGAATYGGSVNFTSVDPSQARGLDAELSSGSLGSWRTAVTGETGALPGGFAAWGRAVLQETDGFKNHSDVRNRAVYFALTRQTDRSLFKVSGFSGLERTQLAYLAAEKDVIERDLRFNDLTPDERDRFAQNFVQAQYTRFLGPASSLALQGYYNGASGWFRVWDDPILRSQLQQYGLDGYFVGAVATYNWTRGPLAITTGLHGGWFTRDHFMDVVGGSRAYTNTGRKSEADGFAKIAYDTGPWHLYGDAQLRWARFRYRGSIDLGSVSWSFFNPKIGARRDLTPSLSVYASVGAASREPARDDMLAGEDNATIRYDLAAVKPERVLDFESGVGYKRPGLAISADLYDMEFHDEIALTGELSAIGLPLRRNVDRSNRRGLEIEAKTDLSDSFHVRGNANWSRNRIVDWTQFYDLYDASGALVGSVGRRFHDVPPLLSPEFMANLGFDWGPVRETTLGLSARYVDRSYLDNTGDADLATPAWFDLDASAIIGLGRWIRAGRPSLRIQVNNVLDDKKLWASGYSYLYITRDATGRDTPGAIPYYYPLATRTIFLTLEFHL